MSRLDALDVKVEEAELQDKRVSRLQRDLDAMAQANAEMDAKAKQLETELELTA